VAEQSAHDDIQRTLNEFTKKELRERYGAEFLAVDEQVPAQVESEWLAQVEEFERQFADRGMTTVRKFIGDPLIIPLEDVPSHSLNAELDRLLKLLAENSIQIDYEGLVGAAETYDFITTELLDQEIEDIRIPGMVTVFVYGRYEGRNPLGTGISH
jgi:hypothetical protein